jgi:hypothetical protein
MFSKLLSAAVVAALAGTATAQTAVTLAGGRLTLTTPGTDQNVKVEMKEGPGVARVFGFPGVAEGTVYTGVSAVTVNTGAGRDEVQFDIEQPGSLDVRANTGAGDALSKVQWKVTRGGAGPVTAGLTLGSAAGGLQLAEVKFDVEFGGRTQINVDTGNAGEQNTEVNADDPAEFLGVNFNSRASKSTLGVTAAAPTVSVGLRGVHTAPLNELKYELKQLSTGSIAVSADVRTGGGDDKIEAKVSTMASAALLTGVVETGAGNDAAIFEVEGASNVFGLSLRGGAGNDFLSILSKGPFQLSQTVGVSIRGGDGDDFLILKTDSFIRGTGLPNDVTPVIDGGAGFDLFDAFGQILNCEGRL